MTSTARVQIDRFRRIDEVAYLSIMAANRPKTVSGIEAEIIEHFTHISAIIDRIRSAWLIRRELQKKLGIAAVEVRWRSRSIGNDLKSLRYRREVVADLKAAVDRLETGAAS